MRQSAMGHGEELAGVHGSSDYGHLNRNQLRGNDPRVLANSTEYRDGDGEHIGAMAPRQRHGRQLKSSPLWHSSAPFGERRA